MIIKNSFLARAWIFFYLFKENYRKLWHILQIETSKQKQIKSSNNNSTIQGQKLIEWQSSK